jgi:hypothetical protein
VVPQWLASNAYLIEPFIPFNTPGRHFAARFHLIPINVGMAMNHNEQLLLPQQFHVSPGRSGEDHLCRGLPVTAFPANLVIRLTGPPYIRMTVSPADRSISPLRGERSGCQAASPPFCPPPTAGRSVQDTHREQLLVDEAGPIPRPPATPPATSGLSNPPARSSKAPWGGPLLASDYPALPYMGVSSVMLMPQGDAVQ